MRCNAERLIESLATGQAPETTVVTISRSYGAMGHDIAQILADALELRCCDCDILQEVARRANVDESLVKVLDEHVSVINSHYGEQDGHWWERLINRYSFTHLDYQEHLAKTILSISLHGGVIIGRGANFILGPERAFRVRLFGSLEKCAQRVADRDHISFEKAREKVQDINYERTEYIRKLYDADINDPFWYDLVINTDRFDSVQTAELILEALKKAGYTLPDDAFDSLSVTA